MARVPHPVNRITRAIAAIDATLTTQEAPVTEPTTTAKTDTPGTDPGVNLTQQALTDADRAALYPTVPADPPAVDIIDRHLLASTHYYGTPADRLDEARRIVAALTADGWTITGGRPVEPPRDHHRPRHPRIG